jgi:hypothetical protein
MSHSVPNFRYTNFLILCTIVECTPIFMDIIFTVYVFNFMNFIVSLKTHIEGTNTKLLRKIESTGNFLYLFTDQLWYL